MGSKFNLILFIQIVSMLNDGQCIKTIKRLNLLKWVPNILNGPKFNFI